MSLSMREKLGLQKSVKDNLAALRGSQVGMREKLALQRDVKADLAKLGGEAGVEAPTTPLIDRAREAAQRGEVYQAAIKSPAGGWMRKHGLIRGNTIYTHPNAYFPDGQDAADSGKWRQLPASEVDTLLAYIERGDKRSTYYTAAVNILSVVENAAERGEQLRARLEDVQSRHAEIGAITGRGLMIGTHLVDAHGKPDGDRGAKMLKACEHRGLLMIRCGPWGGNVVRWIPPLIVTAEQIDWAVDRFEEALIETGGGSGVQPMRNTG